MPNSIKQVMKLRLNNVAPRSLLSVSELIRNFYLQAMWGGSTSHMWGESLSKTCADSGHRKVSQIRGTRSHLNFDNAQQYHVN